MMSKINDTVQEASKSAELRAFLIVSNCPLEIIYSAMFGHCPVRQILQMCICFECSNIQFACVYLVHTHYILIVCLLALVFAVSNNVDFRPTLFNVSIEVSLLSWKAQTPIFLHEHDRTHGVIDQILQVCDYHDLQQFGLFCCHLQRFNMIQFNRISQNFRAHSLAYTFHESVRSSGSDWSQRCWQVDNDQGLGLCHCAKHLVVKLLFQPPPVQALVGELPITGRSIVWKHPNVRS